jgi:hypothetical protein
VPLDLAANPACLIMLSDAGGLLSTVWELCDFAKLRLDELVTGEFGQKPGPADEFNQKQAAFPKIFADFSTACTGPL